MRTIPAQTGPPGLQPADPGCQPAQIRYCARQKPVPIHPRYGAGGTVSARQVPEWGIRFIALVDHADTNDASNKKARQINGLINEWYLEDLSINVRTVLTHKCQSGQHIGSFAPYGYAKDPARPQPSGHRSGGRRRGTAYLQHGVVRVRRFADRQNLERGRHPQPDPLQTAAGIELCALPEEPGARLMEHRLGAHHSDQPDLYGDLVQGRHKKGKLQI